jgi:hypothetical protein
MTAALTKPTEGYFPLPTSDDVRYWAASAASAMMSCPFLREVRRESV